jgi:hypothetical protein
MAAARRESPVCLDDNLTWLVSILVPRSGRMTLGLKFHRRKEGLGD